MSAPDPRTGPGEPTGLQLGGCLADIVELAALRARAKEFEALAGERGLPLPPLGRSARAGDQLVLCVRPRRHGCCWPRRPIRA